MSQDYERNIVLLVNTDLNVWKIDGIATLYLMKEN